MNILFVVSRMRDWPFCTPGAQVVPARAYLTDPLYSDRTERKVFNLCQSSRYQSRGYYVSMLAEARGHQPIPDIRAIEDLHTGGMACRLAGRLDDLFQSALAHIACGRYELDVCFGRSEDGRFEQLSEQLFNLLRIPLLRARLKNSGGRWQLDEVCALHLEDLDPDARLNAARAAADCLAGHHRRAREPAAKRPRLAILRSHDCPAQPSNAGAIGKFREAAEALGMRSELITHADTGRIAEFDALFIRDTTHVNHYTYRIARAAAVEDMVVMDDAESILRCGNKVFMHELLSRHRLPMPKTMLVHGDNLERVIPALGLPCILKQPDGAFSLGVLKAESAEELRAQAETLFAGSELLLAQEYLPTDFDWRVGILDRKPLFVCRYFMAPGHWQIIRHEGGRATREGQAQSVALDAAPPQVLDLALRAANLIGDGFYGVDIKQRGRQCYVIEINDNPNVDAGNEDGVLQDALYREVMTVFRKRIEARKGA